MNEVAVIDVIERILSGMLEPESRVRVVAYFYDKYNAAEAVPEWTGAKGTPAVSTSGVQGSNWSSGASWGSWG